MCRLNTYSAMVTSLLFLICSCKESPQQDQSPDVVADAGQEQSATQFDKPKSISDLSPEIQTAINTYYLKSNNSIYTLEQTRLSATFNEFSDAMINIATYIPAEADRLNGFSEVVDVWISSKAKRTLKNDGGAWSEWGDVTGIPLQHTRIFRGDKKLEFKAPNSIWFTLVPITDKSITSPFENLRVYEE
jgi:hypothetical protein